MTRASWTGLLLVVAACGRYGFDARRTPDTTSDAPLDAPVVIPDGIVDAAACGSPAPFLAFLDVVVFGNPATQTVRYCYAGLAGPLLAEMRELDGTVFAQATGPIEPAMIDIVIGGANCNACFIRLSANGLVADGPVTDFIGD